jgi:hypothetical protein
MRGGVRELLERYEKTLKVKEVDILTYLRSNNT